METGRLHNRENLSAQKKERNAENLSVRKERRKLLCAKNKKQDYTLWKMNDKTERTSEEIRKEKENVIMKKVNDRTEKMKINGFLGKSAINWKNQQKRAELKSQIVWRKYE